MLLFGCSTNFCQSQYCSCLTYPQVTGRLSMRRAHVCVCPRSHQEPPNCSGAQKVPSVTIKRHFSKSAHGRFLEERDFAKGWHHHPSKPSLSSPSALPVLHDAFPSWCWEDKALLVALDCRDFRCTKQLSIQLLQYLLLTFGVQQNFHAMTDILWKALALLPHLESDLPDCHELSSGSLAMPHVPIQKVVMTLLPWLLHQLSNQIAIADGSERLLDPPNIQWQIKQVLCPSSIYFYSLFKLYDDATCNLLPRLTGHALLRDSPMPWRRKVSQNIPLNRGFSRRHDENPMVRWISIARKELHNDDIPNQPYYHHGFGSFAGLHLTNQLTFQQPCRKIRTGSQTLHPSLPWL